MEQQVHCSYLASLSPEDFQDLEIDIQSAGESSSPVDIDLLEWKAAYDGRYASA